MPTSLPPFGAFRIALVTLGLLGALALWRRPRPAHAVWLLLAMNVLAWAAYVAPLKRPYAFVEHADRAISIGNAACVAAGRSAFEHVQVGHGNLEPMWSIVVAALAGFRPEHVMAAYGWLAPLSIIVVALGLFYGLRTDDSEADAWERALLVLAVLGLSSFSLSQRTPVPPMWAANFLLKPNHAAGWGLVALILGMRARGSQAWKIGLALGLLAWAFLLDFAFLSAGLLVGTWLRRRGDKDIKGLALAMPLSWLIASPYVLHLARDYSPLGTDGTPAQVWRDVLGPALAAPHWVTLDMGLLFQLGIAGGIVLWRRAARRDHEVLGVLVGAWILWGVWAVGATAFGFSPEPDEIHFFLRLTMAMAAGAALAALARYVERARGLALGRGHVLVLAVCLPLTFPAYWDPPSMDRYYRWGLTPVRPKAVQYGAWIRENTAPDAVFLAGPDACVWVPALAGRAVLLISGSRPPADFAARKQAERILLKSRDPTLIWTTAQRFGISYLAIDAPMRDEYGEEALEGLGRLPVYERVFANSAVTILKVRDPRSVAQ